MRIRSAVKMALLAFVLAAVAVMIVKNAHRWQQVGAVSASLAQPPPAPAPVGETAPAADGDRVELPREPPAVPVAMAARANDGGNVVAQAFRDTLAPEEVAPRRVVRVTYFYSSARCISCYKIEALTESAVRTAFSERIAAGGVEWRAINVEEPGNEHYIYDYKLFTKSVIVSEIVEGREVRFKNLDRVWRLLRDEQAFKAYVIDEVAAYLRHS